MEEAYSADSLPVEGKFGAGYENVELLCLLRWGVMCDLIQIPVQFLYHCHLTQFYHPALQTQRQINNRKELH